MFKAFARLIRTVIYIITFQFNKIADVWSNSAAGINAAFDQIAAEKLQQVKAMKDALARKLEYQITQRRRLAGITKEIEDQKNGMKGALFCGQQRLKELQGKTSTEIKTDPEYIRCSEAHNKFKRVAAEKREEAGRIEAELETVENDITAGQRQVERVLSEMGEIEQERGDTLWAADAARARQEYADMKSGITSGPANEERQRMKKLREGLEASAAISERLAGIDEAGRNIDTDFITAGQNADLANEFDQLLGLAEAPPAVEAPPIEASKPLPED